EAGDGDSFKVKEYTIVGLVRSPLYIMHQRGTTSVGDGSIDAYVYLEPDAYDFDYDTDIYVYFDKDTTIYSKEYESFMEEKEEKWEALCQAAADTRYNRIYADAMEEINDADKTLKEEEAKGEKKLGDALAELEDGKNQLVNGESAINKARRKLTAGEKTLKEQEAEYKKGLETYKKNKKTFDEGKKSYEKGLKEYNAKYSEYEENLKTYENNYLAYQASEEQYATAMAQFESGKDYLSEEEQAAKAQELAVWRSTLDGTGQMLAEAKLQLDAASAAFADNKAVLDQTGKELEAGDKELAKAKKQLDSAGKQIEEAKEQLASGKKQITDSERELEDARRELSEGEIEYNNARREYDDKIDDAKQELEDARQEVGDIEKPETYVMGRDTNTGYASYENDAGIIEGVSRVFPIFFFLVAALVCMTTMTRMIEEQRTQIGVLKALGYSNGAVIGKYIAYSGSAAIAGALVGFFAGTWTFSNVIWNAYQMMYDMGELRYVFNPGYAVISVLAALLCSAGTTLVCCFQELQEMAASLMRPKAPKAGKRVLLERITFLWNRMKFLDKVSVRNLFRYKKRLFMMIVGVSGCTALLITGMGIRDSIAKIASLQYEEISLYDLVVGVSEEDIDEEELKTAGIRDYVMTASSSVSMTTGKQTKDVSLRVPQTSDDFGKYMDLHTEDGKAVAFPKDNEVLISFKQAEDYGLKVGDKILLQDSDMRGGNITVGGIYVNYFDHYVIMAPDTYQALFNRKPEYNAFLANIEEGEDVHHAASALMKTDNVTYVSISENVKNHVTDMMKSLDYVVILVVICAAMLAFIVIYNLNNINITERIREIATIKVLGFYKDETNSYVFRENIVLTLLGSLAGVVLGQLLHTFVMSQIKIETIAFDVHVEAGSFVLSVVLTLLFNQIVNLAMSQKLEKIDMAESLKSVE
ncbi:MAG: ABC transporter permease, partial [Lachnospiraceae bacterium]|nr:ABC transporter permease [Lachnospiraceae bacterium]